MHGVNRLDRTRKWDDEVIEAGKRDGGTQLFFFFFHSFLSGQPHKRSTSTENIFQIHSLLWPRACVSKSLDDERERHIAIPCGCDCATLGWWKGRVDYVGLVNTTNHFYKIQGVVENDILVAGALVEP